MDKKTKLIFNRKIALELSRMGFPIIDIVENEHKRLFDIYVFENSDSFKTSFTNLVNQGKFKKSQWRQNSNDNTNYSLTA